MSYFILFRSDIVTLTDIVALTICDKSVSCRLHDAYFNFEVTILYHDSVVIFESQKRSLYEQTLGGCAFYEQ